MLSQIWRCASAPRPRPRMIRCRCRLRCRCCTRPWVRPALFALAAASVLMMAVLLLRRPHRRRRSPETTSSPARKHASAPGRGRGSAPRLPTRSPPWRSIRPPASPSEPVAPGHRRAASSSPNRQPEVAVAPPASPLPFAAVEPASACMPWTSIRAARRPRTACACRRQIKAEPAEHACRATMLSIRCWPRKLGRRARRRSRAPRRRR